MVVNIRGISGSGKSTIVRTVMDHYGPPQPVLLHGRRRPVAQVLRREGLSDLLVLGHYDGVWCGGIDVIKRLTTCALIYDQISRAVAEGQDVLFEGVLVHGDVKYTVPLYQRIREQLVVITLSTPMQECLASGRSRRERGGFTRVPYTESYAMEMQKVLTSAVRRLLEAGVPVEHLTRDEALRRTLQAFGIAEPEQPWNIPTEKPQHSARPLEQFLT